MAKNHFDNGLHTTEMVSATHQYRDMFDIKNVEHVDILDILEFKMPKLYPGFKLVIVKDNALDGDAITNPIENRIYIRETVYVEASKGDPNARMIAAHELGHYLLHRDKNVIMHKTKDGYEEKISKLNSTENVESQADMFARHFLAPPKMAFKYRLDPAGLAKKAGIPAHIAKGNVTICKRRNLIPWR